MTKATVKLGRKPVNNLEGVGIHHWAVQVGHTWYELNADKSWEANTGNASTNFSKDAIKELSFSQCRNGDMKNKIVKSYGTYAISGAGKLGGELVGETDKTSSEIDTWTKEWISKHPSYDAFNDNCQKFAYEFMDWLTDGNFICHHRLNAADLNTQSPPDTKRNFNAVINELIFMNQLIQAKGLAVAKEGNAVARVASRDIRRAHGVFSTSAKFFDLQAQAVAGPGFGAWVDVSLIRSEVSLGNIIGIHAGINASTGVGVRNGNLDVHVLGFGFKVGADGLEADTPVGGVNACSVM